MHPVIKKLNYKNQEKVLVLYSPEEFQIVLNELKDLSSVDQFIRETEYEYILIFVKKVQEIEKFSALITQNISEDAVFWVAYPKKSSKKYSSDINRDNGWQSLGDIGFEGIRQVAIDNDWSALRFRQARLIKSFIRDKNRALSKEGRERLNK